MKAIEEDADTTPRLEGTAYGRSEAHSDLELVQVAAGTPCGEFMRRYWQPVLAASNVTTRPQEVRILGETLIIFRDGQGRPGLLYPRCRHRGTSLFWGHVEQDGIRCCYHGWKYDVEGNCLDQPCEPKGGVNKAAHRQPWYPVREHYGLVWAYMGPPDKMPLLPRFDCMEPLAEDEFYWGSDNSLPAHADLNGPAILPYSWLNMNDNAMDPVHAQILHTTFSVAQFIPEFAKLPKLGFDYIDNGVIWHSEAELEDGQTVKTIVTWMLPNMISVPSLTRAPGRSESLTIIVPVDDTHCRAFVTARMKRDAGNMLAGTAFEKMKPWSKLSIEERQDMPNDYEAQGGQGAISLHSDEHLVTSDRGVDMTRRMLRREIEKVAKGEDPIGVAFKTGEELRPVPSGHFYS
jgi:nitrite reductase/ring-hydroxylating ferredoxin subunit